MGSIARKGRPTSSKQTEASKRWTLPELRALCHDILADDTSKQIPICVGAVGDAAVVGTMQDFKIYEHMVANHLPDSAAAYGELPHMVAALEDLYGEPASRARFWGTVTADQIAANSAKKH
jgi:hypothetical protein